MARCSATRLRAPRWRIRRASIGKEVQQLHRDGKLSPELSRLYFAPTRPMFELFDLESDPAEMKNLAGTKEVEAVEKELKAALQEWMILQRDFVPLPVPPEQPRKKG